MERFSRKRQSILDCLRSTTEHPSAEWIYSRLKAEYPDLSLATVYRNLTRLKKEGLIRSVGIINGQERFDANTTSHTHFACVKCGRITDAFDVVIPDAVSKGLESRSDFTVLRADLTVSGICEECRKKEQE